MAYVYMHIREDKNEPFYIGIGNDTSGYKRAYSKRNRNNYWHNIVNKTSYTVHILYDDVTWGDACSKEIDLIAKYKKKSCGGTLCNIADGGNGGNLGEDVSKIMSERRKGHNNGNSFKVYQYTLDGEFIKEWGCAKYASDYYNVTYQNITNCIRGSQKSAVGFKWSKIKLHEE